MSINKEEIKELKEKYERCIVIFNKQLHELFMTGDRSEAMTQDIAEAYNIVLGKKTMLNIVIKELEELLKT